MCTSDSSIMYLNTKFDDSVVFDELYGLDDFVFDLLDSNSPSTPSTDLCSDSSDQSHEEVPPRKRKGVQSSGVPVTKRASRTPKSATRTQIKAFKKGMTVKEALIASGPDPNMSRRNPSNVLIAFPHFDKCDSLVYFTTSLVRHCNSADFAAVNKLVLSHVHRDCKVRFSCGGMQEISTQVFLRMLEFTDSLQPDQVMCVHATKVEGNTIRSTIYAKVTDSQSLYSLISPTETYKQSMVAFQDMAQRPDRFLRFAEDGNHDENTKQEILALSHAVDDVLMYQRVDFVLTIDDATHKIVAIDGTFQITSLCIVQS